MHAGREASKRKHNVFLSVNEVLDVFGLSEDGQGGSSSVVNFEFIPDTRSSRVSQSRVDLGLHTLRLGMEKAGINIRFICMIPAGHPLHPGKQGDERSVFAYLEDLDLSKVISISEYGQRFILEGLGLGPREISQIRNGTDPGYAMNRDILLACGCELLSVIRYPVNDGAIISGELLHSDHRVKYKTPSQKITYDAPTGIVDGKTGYDVAEMAITRNNVALSVNDLQKQYPGSVKLYITGAYSSWLCISSPQPSSALLAALEMSGIENTDPASLKGWKSWPVTELFAWLENIGCWPVLALGDNDIQYTVSSRSRFSVIPDSRKSIPDDAMRARALEMEIERLKREVSRIRGGTES